jgi:hypothetical protein
METTTEAPTVDGFYWARAKDLATGQWKPWTVIEWGMDTFVGLGKSHVYDWKHDGDWERSVEPIQSPAEGV